MPSPRHAGNIINAVSCASAGSCMAVGYTVRHGDITHALTEHWNGARWSIVPTPRIPDTLPTTWFNGVSCPGQNFCVGVGYFDRNLTLYPLAEVWNGHRWSLRLPSNDGGAFPAQLEGVSCPSSRRCVAVGLGGERALENVVERWNGRGWTATTSHAFPSGWTWNAIACTSADACMAVGGPWSGSFNGRHWTIRRIPGMSDAFHSGEPGAVSCSSASACMTVSQTGGFHSRMLAAYWNGGRWTNESVPFPPPPPGIPPSCAPNSPVPECTPGQSYQYTTPASLTGVSCAASSDCEAIGSATDTQNGAEVVIATHWDGTSWSTQAPSSVPSNMTFSSVSCPIGDVCETVGETQARNGTLEGARFG
ncbi:MAG: hypothetical protein ACRDMJ_00095 [Solirubrobacteraceae bacterium]